MVPPKLSADLATALARLRMAREMADVDLEWVAQKRLDNLIDQIPRTP